MTEPNLELSRRMLLAAAGIGTGAIATAAIASDARAAVSSGQPTAPAPTVAGLHLQFGGDASSEVTVSWHTLTTSPSRPSTPITPG